MSNTETLSRQQLYDLVWSTPLQTLSKKYALSDNGLRKICIRMGIPLPQAGHWMQIQFKKKVSITPLPANYTGTEAIDLPLRTENNPLSTKKLVKELADSLRADDKICFTIPERLHTKNPHILAAKTTLAQSQKYAHCGVVNCHHGELDIKVGIDSVSRMLRFADTLLRVFEQRQHRIDFISGDTRVNVKGQHIKILFRERLKKHIVKGTYYDSTELHPTGILVFKLDAYHTKEWSDGKEPLEYYLPEIVATLEIESNRLTKRDEEWRIEREKRELEEQRKRELQARKMKDLEHFKNLLSKSDRWHKAVNLRNYIEEVEKNNTATSEWLNWARKKADWYDPFLEAGDEMLEAVDRDNLTLLFK